MAVFGALCQWSRNFFCIVSNTFWSHLHFGNHYKLAKYLVAWNRVLLEHASVPRLPKRFHTFYGTRSSLQSSKKPANSPLLKYRKTGAHVPQGLSNDPTLVARGLLRWCGIRMQAEACIRIPHHTTPAKPQGNTNTHRTRAIQPMK